MMARAGKKGRADAFVTDCMLSAAKDKWTEAKKANKNLMAAVWH
jgi:hypothetical protein